MGDMESERKRENLEVGDDRRTYTLLMWRRENTPTANSRIQILEITVQYNKIYFYCIWRERDFVN